MVGLDEQLYTLAEAELLLREALRRDMCMSGAGAPGHMVRETVTRNGADEISAWSLSCQRCGAAFVATYP